MQVSESNNALIAVGSLLSLTAAQLYRVLLFAKSPYDMFMRKHLKHYGYFTGRSEMIKKYGFIPPNSHLLSVSSDNDESSDDDDSASSKDKTPASETRTSVRPIRVTCSLNVRSVPSDDNSFEPRWPIEMEVLSEARVKHLDAPPQQAEPFHTSTNSHTPFVRSFDENNGRVVFDYRPETCGYFIRSRIGGNREGCRQLAAEIRGADDTTVLFESRFESGNLMKAVQVGEFEYELYVRYDLYTKRNTQWFYFRLENIRANQRYRFSIVNFFKSASLYNDGMRPLLYSVHDADTLGVGWRRWGEDIVYYKNNLTAPDKATSNMYSLTWTCKFPNDHDTYYFAHCYPYTYSDLQDYLNDIQSDRWKSQYCKQKVLCRTLAGNFIHMLTITSSTATVKHTVGESPVKKGVVITARVHPGETNASWMMKGLLDFLLGDSTDAKILRENFIFRIIPMLNPDGVIVGNYRCSLSGRDLNRNYKTILKDAYPSIWHTREMIKKFMAEVDVVLYCDFHGHSRKQNVFIYGCENKYSSDKRLQERIFPSMLSKNDPGKFSFYSCKFKVQKHKEGTGRVVMWSLGIMNSFTLEATFCGSTQHDRAGHHFNTRDLESIGYHFLDSLLDYCDPDRTKCDRILDELEDGMRQSIAMKLLSRGLPASSINDIDLDQFFSDNDSSDDAGSDSSMDDGLPKHLEAIAAAGKIRLKKTIKKKASSNVGRDCHRKDEADKENNEKSKTTSLSVSKPRNLQLPAIGPEIPKATPRQALEPSVDAVRYDITNTSTDRWPMLTRARQMTQRMTPAENRTRRTQRLLSNIYVSDQTSAISDGGLVKEIGNAFTATYLLRRLNNLERELSADVSSPSYNTENTGQVSTDNEGDLDRSRTQAPADSEEKRQLLDSYVKNQLTLQLSERLLGGSRCVARSKPATVTTIQNRTLLDIRAIQPPAQNQNPNRIADQQQRQRKRVMVVFGKQDPNEVSSSTSRSLLVPIDERMACNPDLSVSTITKLTESVPPYFFSRHEATASFLSNTTATMKTSETKKPPK